MQNVSRKSVIFKAAHAVAKKETIANPSVSYKEAFSKALKAIHARVHAVGVHEISVEALVASPVEVCLAKAERIKASSYQEFLDKLPEGFAEGLSDLSPWPSLARLKEEMVFFYEQGICSRVVLVLPL